MIATCFRAFGEGIAYGFGHGVGLALAAVACFALYRRLSQGGLG